MRKSIYIIALGFFLQLPSVGIGSEVSSSRESEMRFDVYDYCRSATGRGCPTQILLRGIIKNDSAIKLRKFLEKKYPKKDYGFRNLVFIFDSPGGSVAGGMELGLYIRSTKIRTEISKSYNYYSEEKHGEKWEGSTLVESPICASSCVLAFVGGAMRSVEQGALLGVHQFFTDRGDLSEGETQKMTAIISSYLHRLGIDRRLLDIASFTPSNQITWLTNNQAIEFAVDTTSLAKLMRLIVEVSSEGKPQLLGKIKTVSGEFYLAMTYIDGQILVNMLDGYFSESNRPAPDLSNQEPVQVSFCNGWEGCVLPKPVSGWSLRKSRNRVFLEAAAILSVEQALSIATYPRLTYHDGKSMASGDYSRDFLISSDGFSEKIKLIARSK